MIEDYLKNILTNINLLTLAVTVVIAIVGWIFALILQHRNIKHQHKVQIRYDIYKQFVQLHKDIQNTVIKLGTTANPPFILMNSCMIPFELELKKEFKEQWIPWSEMECVHEGEKKWNSFIQELNLLYFDFGNKYIGILYIFEDWTAALNPLLPAKDILIKETERLKKHINDQLEVLRMYSVNRKHDWRKWDQKEIEEISKKINEDASEIGCYWEDFMILIHNELLSKYFGYTRPTRKTLDPKYKVLTKKGITESMDWKQIKKMKVHKEKLTKIAENQLKNPSTFISPENTKILDSIIKNICPVCNNSIEVFEIKKTANSLNFQYTCGHNWEVNTPQKTNYLKTLLKKTTATLEKSLARIKVSRRKKR